jgi:hypothetical protein
LNASSQGGARAHFCPFTLATKGGSRDVKPNSKYK